MLTGFSPAAGLHDNTPRHSSAGKTLTENHIFEASLRHIPGATPDDALATILAALHDPPIRTWLQPRKPLAAVEGGTMGR